MRAVVALVAFSLLWCSAHAALVQFNSSLASECAEAPGCNFMNETLWVGGVAPRDGDNVEIVGELAAVPHLYLSGANLTSISLYLNTAALVVDSMSMLLTNVTLQSMSSITVNFTALEVTELLSLTSSTISIQEESSLTLDGTVSYFFLDTNSELMVADTSMLLSSTASWLHGNVTTSGSAVLVFYATVSFAGSNTFGSSQGVQASNVTFMSNNAFPTGLEAEHVDILDNLWISVHQYLLIEGSLFIGNSSTFTIASVQDGQILAETNNGAVYGNGTLQILSSSVAIAPPGFHDDGNYTDFQGTLVVGGQTNLTLALYFLYDVTFTTGVSGEPANVLINAFSVFIINELNLPGSITAYWFDDFLDSLTVFAPLTLDQCITSVGASLTFDASVTCGGESPLVVNSEPYAAIPVVTIIGFGTTIASVVVSAANIQLNNCTVEASGLSVFGTSGGIEFMNTEVTFQQGAALLASNITFNGNNAVWLLDDSSFTFTTAFTLGGTSTLYLNQQSLLISGHPESVLTQLAGTAIYMTGTSMLQSAGNSSFAGTLNLQDESQLDVNNVAVTGTSVFNTTGAVSFNGEVSWSGVHSFPRGFSFGAANVLKTGTILQVWSSFSAYGPLYLESGSALILQDCQAYFKSNNNQSALSGPGNLTALSSYVDFDAIGTNYVYSDFEGILTIGGQSTWSLVLFTFNNVNFVTGTSGEAPNVTLEAYGVRFAQPIQWHGNVILQAGVEDYPSLEVYHPVSVWDFQSQSATMNLTSSLTCSGPAVFSQPDNFISMVLAGNGSLFSAPSVTLLNTQYFVATGTSHIIGTVVNGAGSNITIDRDARLIITGDYWGDNAVIAYNYLDTSSGASAPINVSNTAYLNGTTAWYSTLLEEGNPILKENLNNVPVLEAKTVFGNITFDKVFAGVPMGAFVNITSGVSTMPNGRDVVYISNAFAGPTPDDSKPVYKLWWFWFLIILAICAILGGVAYYVRNRKRSMYTPLEM